MNTKTKKKNDIDRAEELMNLYAAANEHRTALVESIMEELKAVELSMKETELELIAIGEKNKSKFDAKDNLHLEKGYLHIARKTVILTKKTFDLATFAEERPEMVDYTLKVKPIKDAWLDKNMQKELRALKITVDTTKKVEVKLNKPAK